MATDDAYEPVWRKCDECDVVYFIGATLNPRNHRWSPIPLSRFPDLDGNFEIDWHQDHVEVFSAADEELGLCPVVVYGVGNYRPHNPSHLLEHSHGEEEPRQRLGNFRLAMDEHEESERNPRHA